MALPVSLDDTAPKQPRSDPNPILKFLFGRRSCHALRDPGPDAQALEKILYAGTCAPDFRRLQPFRVLAASGDGRHRLGAMMQRAACRDGRDAEIIERAPRMPLRAPLVLAVISSPREDPIVPLLDQQFAAASALLMMQLAAHALGFGSVWRSGWPMYSPALHDELGLSEGERIVGFLYIGTPAEGAKFRAHPEDASCDVTWI